MKPTFCAVVQDVFSLTLPMEELTTAVYLFCTEQGAVLFDTGNDARDVENAIVPALAEQGLALADLVACVVSHSHGDHAGGVRALHALCPTLPFYAADVFYLPPDAVVHAVSEDGTLCGSLRLVRLAGHTHDCVGIYHLPTRTLFSVDALQQRGIGRYGLSIGTLHGYLQTIDKIASLAPRAVVSSHHYVPLGMSAEGEAVGQLLAQCRADVLAVADFVHEAVQDAPADAGVLTQVFRQTHLDWPTLAQCTVEASLQEKTVRL